MSEYEDDFNKMYFFKKPEEYVAPDKVFECPKWSIPELQNKKIDLNKVKGRLSKYQLKIWSKHTATRDRAGFVMRRLSEKVKPELLTQAWCKFYEILAHFPVIPLCAVSNQKLNSLHLCEAPGAFVCALNHYLILNYPGLDWFWKGVTLNPNYEGNDLKEMIPDDRFIRHTLGNWNFGSDFSGDLTKFYNFLHLIDERKDSKISLITADGSIDCMSDPGEQERHVERLHFCETMSALALLQPGGTFVLKIFTMFEDSTICLLYLLNCLFENVAVFKPCTSKSGNSELYVVNTKFKGFDSVKKIWTNLTSAFRDINIFGSKSLFAMNDIPKSFLDEIYKCSDYFTTKQVQTILDNIYTFEHRTHDNIYMEKTFVAQIYLAKYELRPIPDDLRIVPNVCVAEGWRVHCAQKSKDIYRVKKENIVKKNTLRSVVDIVIGRQIDTVYNSKFTQSDNLKRVPGFFKKNAQSSHLYKYILKALDEKNVLINISDFIYNSFSNFQKQFFEHLLSALNKSKNIILINIPLVTHFLVGLLYILFFCFEKVYLGSGIVFLFLPKISDLNNVIDIFNKIKAAYKLTDNLETEFVQDIVQIVSPTLFEHGSFIEKVWNYNNQLFREDKCFVRPFTRLRIG